MSLPIIANNKTLSRNSLIDEIKYYKKIIFDLIKVRITIMVAITTIVGYVMFHSRFDFRVAFTTLGVFLLACGASALNEYQERHSDKLMARTKQRPIPSGKISPTIALLISLSFIIMGGIILALLGTTALLLGLFTLIWYNFVYTPLKYKHPLAILPGSIIGAMPPLIGWVSAGGEITSVEIVVFAAFLFIWQIPHFWLLLLLYDDDYKAGGFPTLTKLFNRKQLSLLTFMLIICLVLFSSSLLLFSISSSLINIAAFILLGILLLALSSKIIVDKKKTTYKKTFLYVNFYVLLILLVIVLDKTI